MNEQCQNPLEKS